MQTELSFDIQHNPALVQDVERANALLKDELGPSEPIVTTRWSLSNDIQQGAVVDLEISDPIATINAQFLPKELNRNGDKLLGRLRKLWMGLLTRRFDIHFAQTKKAILQELEGE